MACHHVPSSGRLLAPRCAAMVRIRNFIVHRYESVDPVIVYDIVAARLPTASAVYRFEALRGRLLFVRPERRDDHAAFYSLTCREYEDFIETCPRSRRYARATA